MKHEVSYQEKLSILQVTCWAQVVWKSWESGTGEVRVAVLYLSFHCCCPGRTPEGTGFGQGLRVGHVGGQWVQGVCPAGDTAAGHISTLSSSGQQCPFRWVDPSSRGMPTRGAGHVGSRPGESRRQWLGRCLDSKLPFPLAPTLQGGMFPAKPPRTGAGAAACSHFSWSYTEPRLCRRINGAVDLWGKGLFGP